MEKINKKIEHLDSVLQGKGLMTTDIRKVLDNLMDRTLPKEWEDFWGEVEDPAEWIRRFGRKMLLLKGWVHRAKEARIKG
jgi:hypothetical protein